MAAPIVTSFRLRLSTILAIILSISFTSCKDNDPGPGAPVSEENQYVNKWIRDNMEDYYLWNDDLPENVDRNLDPAEYFTKLISPDDRFSWIQPDYGELLKSLKGITREAGYEFVLYRESNESNKVSAQVMYVKPSSSADASGLKRGDLISKINGHSITVSNYQDLLKNLRQNHSLTYQPLNFEQSSFGAETTVQLSAVEYSENPNYLSTIINTGDQKIGYYVYNFFAPGADQDDQTYDEEMDAIFTSFRNEGITDLIVDLRFNSGGSEASAKNLASLITPGVTGDDIFFTRVYNDQLMEEIINDPQLGSNILKSFFVEKPSNVGMQLRNNRVYILTSSRTASASELIINSLEPYMDVFLIGDVTLGKNVGSISIYEENDPKNTWGLQPIIVKVSNKSGFSDYGDGFTPDILDQDNSLYIYPLGDERENLLHIAIGHITGTGESGRVRATDSERSIIGHSLDEKRRGFNLFLDF